MAPHEENCSSAALSPLELGQRCLKEGDPSAAIKHLREALELPGGASIDTHLVLAEALWQEAGGNGTDLALPHYEAAAALAAAAGDTPKEAMVALGHGFALSQLGRAAAARGRLGRAKDLAEAEGNADAVRFINKLLEQVDAGPQRVDGPEAIRSTWRQFAEALSAGKPAMLFLRGTLALPADEASQRGVRKLRAAGCPRLEVVDVCDPGVDVPDGLQGFSSSVHLSFPQLFVAGTELDGWLDLPPDSLRQRLGEAGAELGEPHEEPCHGTAAFAEGLEAWEVALVELVSQRGTTDWPGIAEALSTKGIGGPDNGEAVEAEWRRLAPLVRDKLEKQPEMPCGHSCSTCPTRHDCHLHEAIGDSAGGGMRDIEDLAGGRGK